MDYEKAYKEALNRAREEYKTHESFNGFRVMLLNIFPELEESEDERIRKSIIGFLITISSLKDGKTVSNEDFDSKTILEWVAWLEKLKEFVSTDFDDVWETADCEKLTAPLEKYSKDAIKEMCHAWYDKGIELERKSWLEKQGKQKQTQRKDFISIPFGAFDSELIEESITIPDGCYAVIEGRKVYIKKKVHY